MGVVLDEPPDSSQTRQTSARLVSVQDTKLGHSEGKLLVGSVSRVKDEAVAGTVHRLKRKLFLVDVHQEHVVLVVGVVAGLLPEIDVEHGRGDD